MTNMCTVFRFQIQDIQVDILRGLNYDKQSWYILFQHLPRDLPIISILFQIEFVEFIDLMTCLQVTQPKCHCSTSLSCRMSYITHLN